MICRLIGKTSSPFPFIPTYQVAMQSKGFIAAGFIALTGLSLYALMPCNTVSGIALGDTLYANQSPIENFQLRRLVRKTIDGDAGAFADLVSFADGGGESSYDHGAALVQVLMRVGDFQFAAMSGSLDNPSKSNLGGLLAAGFEYGFRTPISEAEARATYPLTMDAVEGNSRAR